MKSIYIVPVACAANRSRADVPGLVALTPNALTRTEKRAPDFCRRSLIPLYNHEIAQGMAPKSVDGVTEPNIVRDWPEIYIENAVDNYLLQKYYDNNDVLRSFFLLNKWTN